MRQTNLCHRVTSDYLTTFSAAKPVQQLSKLKLKVMDVTKCLGKVNKLIFQGVLEFTLHLLSWKVKSSIAPCGLKTIHSFLLSSFIHTSVHPSIHSFVHLHINPWSTVHQPHTSQTQKTSLRMPLPISKILNAGCELASQGPYWFIWDLWRLKVLVCI